MLLLEDYCMKKIISGFLAFLLAFTGLVSITASAISESPFSPENNLPTVFIGGKGTTLIDKDGNKIYPLNYSTDSIKQAVMNCLPILSKAIITDNYDEYCEALYAEVAKVYAGMPISPDGTVTDGSGTDFRWSDEFIKQRVKNNRLYNMYDYTFYYDWRTDPCDIADQLDAYITDIKRITGAPQVRVIGRCMGGNIVMAYLTEYGWKNDVETCIFYCTTVNGTALPGASFSNQFNLDSDSITRYAVDYLGDDDIQGLLKGTLVLCNENYTLEIPKAALSAIYDKIAAKVVTRLLIATYATFPTYWSMISDEYFDDAVNYTFNGEREEYAGMIKRITYYHDNVQLKVNETLSKLMADGMKLYIVCKYGRQAIPLTKEHDELSDDAVELYSSSFGATCSLVNETLPDEYIESLNRAGLEKYLSPDKQVDASTAFLPEHTWYIKNNAHSDFAKCIDELMMLLVRSDEYVTVNDLPEYPQFLVYNKEQNTIKPMDLTNFNTDERWNTNIFKAYINFIKAFFTYLKLSFNAKTATA